MSDGVQSIDGVVDVVRPHVQTAPIVFASPHSGSFYPQDFIEASRLDPLTLRRSEDAFVDDLFADVVDFGAPLLRAHFPRAYVDPNREKLELDPSMFDGEVPQDANTGSPRVSAGLGTIARVVTSGDEIYRKKINVAEGLARIEKYYTPYHDTLRALVEETFEQFGACLLVDCHSMPSVGGPMDLDPGAKRVDMVLGDCHGTACDRVISDHIDKLLSAFGYNVKRNEPYAGGFTTQHYGRPDQSLQAIQIEINRALYMDEKLIERSDGFTELKSNLGSFAKDLCAVDANFFAAAR